VDLSAAVAAETEVPGSGQFGNQAAAPWLAVGIVAGVAGLVVLGTSL
jgi:hypothetical protein